MARLGLRWTDLNRARRDGLTVVRRLTAHDAVNSPHNNKPPPPFSHRPPSPPLTPRRRRHLYERLATVDHVVPTSRHDRRSEHLRDYRIRSRESDERGRRVQRRRLCDPAHRERNGPLPRCVAPRGLERRIPLDAPAPLLEVLPSFAYSMPVQVLVLGTCVTLLCVLLILLLFTVRYHLPLSKVNYWLQVSWAQLVPEDDVSSRVDRSER